MVDSRYMYDNHGRPVNYLRLAVTDRCNLRCFYCMPEDGTPYLPKKELLTYEEMERLVTLLARMGVDKIRITGGEPFLRKDMLYFLKRIKTIPGIDSLHITTNGVLTYDYVSALKSLGVGSVNLSLDTFNRENFRAITGRDEFERVKKSFYHLLDYDIPVKINAVVMEGKNEDDIITLGELSRQYPVEVRFIEEMPFNGQGNRYPQLKWSYQAIINRLQQAFPGLEALGAPQHGTASLFRVPGARGKIGVIAAFSRTFCDTCNRIRITPQGNLKTCLYDNGVMDLKGMLREGYDDQAVAAALRNAIDKRAKDGFEAEKNRTSPVNETMSSIGG